MGVLSGFMNWLLDRAPTRDEDINILTGHTETTKSSKAVEVQKKYGRRFEKFAVGQIELSTIPYNIDVDDDGNIVEWLKIPEENIDWVLHRELIYINEFNDKTIIEHYIDHAQDFEYRRTLVNDLTVEYSYRKGSEPWKYYEIKIDGSRYYILNEETLKLKKSLGIDVHYPVTEHEHIYNFFPVGEILDYKKCILTDGYSGNRYMSYAPTFIMKKGMACYGTDGGNSYYCG